MKQPRDDTWLVIVTAILLAIFIRFMVVDGAITVGCPSPSEYYAIEEG